ncbi:hypothetical protein NKI95_02860 [Mesorhizobium sp. M0306]|uniref:hypothetical protein n=1 Tax=Mesorhizobium sp. M0306 TaxID=2956932 RepID=UPI00333C95F9
MPEFTISRRTMLAGSALLLASTAMPTIGSAQTPRKGGRLVVAAEGMSGGEKKQGGPAFGKPVKPG